MNNNKTKSEAFIQLNNVVKTYRTAAGDFNALNGLDLHITKGEYVVVVGSSGSGKTTFLNMVTGIDRPSSGQIINGGTAVHALPEQGLARWRGRNVGIVFQFFQLMPTLTVLENILLPMDLCAVLKSGERKNRAMALLDRVGVADQAHKLPTALSGGQQQRVAIARALANDPELIVADEPTGNLDSRTSEKVITLFEELTRDNKTLIVVTHEQNLAGQGNRTVTIKDGQVMDDRRH